MALKKTLLSVFYVGIRFFPLRAFSNRSDAIGRCEQLKKEQLRLGDDGVHCLFISSIFDLNECLTCTRACVDPKRCRACRSFSLYLFYFILKYTNNLQRQVVVCFLLKHDPSGRKGRGCKKRGWRGETRDEEGHGGDERRGCRRPKPPCSHPSLSDTVRLAALFSDCHGLFFSFLISFVSV